MEEDRKLVFNHPDYKPLLMTSYLPTQKQKMKIKQLTKEELDRRYIEDLIYRKNLEVVATMKTIKHGLFSWKEEK